MAYNSRLGYDPDKDYSEALSNPTISDAQRAQLTSERQAKINDMYGGTEPTYGNTGKTFSSMYGANGAGATYDYGDNTTLRTNDRVGGITRAANGTPYAQTGASLAGHGLHDYVNDTTDYTTLALQSQSVEELLTRLAERSMKAEAQGLDISGGTPGYRSNEDIAKEWRATIGNNLPSQFVSRSTGQSGVGYYGQDETGDWGYYADPARTQKLDYGNWGDVAPKQALGTAATYIAQNPDALNGVSDVYSQYLNAISGAGGIGLTNYSAPEVDTKWRDIADKLADAYIGMNYNDWTNSDQYKSLADRYGNQGKMSMQDVLGQIASRTGGLASSYASTAAQQQYNQYMAMLEEVARNSYNEDRNQMYNNAKMALDYYGRDYGEYLDQLAQMNKDRDYNLDALTRALSQSNWERQWQNTLEQQGIDAAKYMDETLYNRRRNSYNDLVDLAQLGAGYGDYGYLSDLGITPVETYSTTFTWPQVQDYLKKNGKLEGKMQQDYNYYMYGDPYYSAGSTSEVEPPAASPTPAANPTPAKRTTTNNTSSGITQDQIQILQDKLGVTADGSWGPKSQQAALNQWGVSDLNEAWERFGQNESVPAGMYVNPLAPGRNGSPTAYKNTESGESVSNRNGDGWVYVTGLGRMTYDELLDKVNSGDVIETYDSKTNTYTYRKR